LNIPVIDPFGIAADPKMPFLARALDPVEVERQFERHVTLASGEKNVHVRAARVSRYKPGRRCLIEYDLEAGQPGSAYRVITVVGKARAKGLDEATYELAKNLWASGFHANSEDGICVPEPIGVIPQFQMWLQHKVPGVIATRLLAGPSGVALARRIAEAIHKLHCSGITPWRRHTMADELRVLHERLAFVAESHPQWSQRLERLLDACDLMGAAIPEPKLRGIHRDFYPDQVIVDGPRLYLLDFDLYSEGDPALDIGNFSGHLVEQSLRKLGNPHALADRQQAIEERFLELAGEASRAAVRAYTVLTLVRHIYLSTQYPKRQPLTESLLELCEDQIGTRINTCDSISRRPMAESTPLTATEESVIPRRTNSRPCLLSLAQQRLWFLNQLRPDDALHNIFVAVRLEGTLDGSTLRAALEAIVVRHESLRTTIVALGGKPPQQVIAERQTVELRVIDLSGLPPSERAGEARRQAIAEARRPFDLAHGPLYRFGLYRLGEAEHVLVLGMHQIVADQWSVRLLLQELATLYEAFSSGQPSPLATLPIQYADFAIWQRDQVPGERLQAQLSYWKQQLSGLPALELPTDRPRPPLQSCRGARQHMLVPQAVARGLAHLSHREGATLFMTLLAAFRCLLHRYTGQEDFAVGSPIAGRNRVEIEGLIGCLANTLVLRTDVSGNLPFRELLRREREVTRSAHAHAELPFAKLVEELHPERSLSQSPLFQVTFQLRDEKDVELSGLKTELFDMDIGVSSFDLAWEVAENSEGLSCQAEYNTDLFDSATITRMLGHYQTLLQAIVADPDRPVSHLPLLTEAERHQLLVEWNDTSADFPENACLHELFEIQVERTPDAVAAVFEDQQLTYRELNTRANKIAHYLQSLGVGSETLVAICLERSLEMVVGILGILKAGGAYVPLDPAYPQQRLMFILQDIQTPVLLTQGALREARPESAAQVLCLDTDGHVIDQQSGANPTSGVTADNLAYVIYTSGSTGQPKGVMIQHRALVNHMHWVQSAFPFSESDRELQQTPFTFDVSVWEFFAPLLCGARLILARPDGHRDSAYLVTVIAQHGITSIQLVPSMLRMLVDEPGFRACTSLRRVFCGAEALPVELAERLLAILDVELVNVYGPTETCIDATYWRCRRGQPTVFIGRPLANTQTYILDWHGQPVPIGVPGELYVGGAGLARGYLNRPELTEEKFVPHPFDRKPGSRLYRTGDRARYRPDGNIEFLGRIDYQVKLRGFRVELGEVEAVLSQHPAVQETVVVVREDSPGDKRLVAYVVPDPSRAPEVGELRGFLKQKLPEYMTPSAFVLLDALPLTTSGKVDRLRLPAPDGARTELQSGYVAPRNVVEERLVKLWQDVLGIDRISVTDNFFDLGGHSLLAVRLFVKIERSLARSLPLASIFEAPTVEQLAARIGAASPSATSGCVVVLQGAGTKPPLFCLAGLHGHAFRFRHLVRPLGVDQPLYGLQYPGLDGQSEPLTKVEDIAAELIQHIRQVQPQGPYYLSGYSFGGLVAYEIAQQLTAQDQPVGMLAFFDTLAPDLYDAAARSKEEMERADHSPDAGSSLLNWLDRVTMANNHAADCYVPQPYPGRVVLFRAAEPWDETEPGSEHNDDPCNGWGDLVRGGLEVHVVPGDHYKILDKPHAGVLGEKLRACLLEAQMPTP
jgi:amino acid adenylation domain-containing protein